MLFTIICISQWNVNKTQWDELKKSEFPSVCMFFADWCHYCKSVLPKYIQLQKEYEENKDINVLTVNCSDQDNFCDNLDVHAFPTFLIIFNGEIRKIRIKYSFESLKDMAEKLIGLNNHTYVQPLPKSFDTYPSFIFHVHNGDKQMEDIAYKIALSGSFIYPTSFYLDYIPKEQNPAVSAFLADGLEVKMNGSYNLKTIQKFYKEYKNPFFGDWRYNHLLKTQRKYIVLLLNHDDNVEEYRKIANQYYKEYAWGLTIREENETHGPFHVFNLTKEELPAIACVEGGGKKIFYKYEKISSPSEVHIFINNITSKKLEKHKFPKRKSETDELIETILYGCFIGVGISIIIVFVAAIVGFSISKHYKSQQKND